MNMDIYQKALDEYSISDSTTEKILQKMIESSKPPRRIVRNFAVSAAVGCVAIACAFIGLHFFNATPPDVIAPGPIGTSSLSSGQATSNNPTTSTDTKTAPMPNPSTSKTDLTKNTISTPTTLLPTTPIVPTDGIVWNRVKAGPNSMLYKDPKATAQYFDLAKFIEYVGYDPFPKQLPKGYELQGTYGKELYFNPDGTPTDYFCGFGLSYYNGENSITVSVSKAKVNAHSSVAIYDDAQRKIFSSKVKGKTILLKVFTPPILGSKVTRSAEFQVDGLNYYAYATNDVSPENFLEVIASLVYC